MTGDSFELEAEDDDGDETGLAAVRRHARGPGVKLAYRAALELCADKKAPAQARANAIRAVFSAAGLLTAAAETGAGKPIYEMTAAEIEQERVKLARELAELEQPRDFFE